MNGPRSRRVNFGRAIRAGCWGAALLAACSGLACGHRPAAPTAPPGGGGPPPSFIEAVHPPARSSGVFYETEVWVQFASALDTTTVNDRTVFFKADTRRLPITITCDAVTRRLRITPRDRLGLRQTYTVELASTIRSMNGTTLGQSYFWQFTTNSLRRPESPSPMDRSLQESPFVALRWGGLTESTAGVSTYEIHIGPDSVQVADPSDPPLDVLATGSFVPRTRWRQGGSNYWAVHARNTVTGERLVSPVWRFDTYPLDTPVDSVAAAVQDWDWVDPANARNRCTEDSLAMGPNFTSTIRWVLSPPDTAAKLAGVAIELTPRYAAVAAIAGPSVWYAVSTWMGCNQSATGPPNTDETQGKLADAVVLAPNRIRFSSDALAAHVEASRRFGGYYGYLFRSPVRRSFYGPGAGSTVVRAVMWMYVYRPAPAPLAASPTGR
jgi:hypothetical protein